MKWKMNLKDESGCIRTGYEEVLEGTKEEVINDYLYFLNIIREMNVTEENIDIEYIDY